MAVKKKKTVPNEILLLDALKDLCSEKGIPLDLMFDAIEAALVFACKKTLGADKNIRVDINRETGIYHIKELREVVETVTKPSTEISLADAQRVNPDLQVGEFVSKEISAEGFGRIAAQAAKQVVTQKIRDAERIMIYDEFTDRANDVVNGNVVRIEDGNAIIDIGKTEAVLAAAEQMPNDRIKVGDRVKAYVAEVRKIGKGPQVYLSRTHPGFLRRLFELEVPEIQEKIVLVKCIAREAGMRSKVAVISGDEDIDAVGSCVGQHGIRIQAIVDELSDEKIDIVQWDADPAVFIANALSPSKVIRVSVNEMDKVSRVVVPNNQLSLAIGKEGQNARLAAKLTGWKIDIKSKSQAKGEELGEDFRTVKIQPAKFFSSTLKAKQPKNNTDRNSDDTSSKG